MAISAYDACHSHIITRKPRLPTPTWGPGSFPPIIRDNLLTVMEMITFIIIWTEYFSEVLLHSYNSV